MGIIARLTKKIKNFYSGRKSDKGGVSGKRFEKQVGRKLKRIGVNVVAQGKKYDYKGKKGGAEVDIETPRTAIEVKSGKNTSLERRLDKYKEVLPHKEPIAYAPKIKEQYYQKLKKQNYVVFKEFGSLTDHLYNKGEFTRKGAKKYQRRWNRRHK